MENTPDATTQLFLLNYESKTNRPATRNARPSHCRCRAAPANWLRGFAVAKMAFGRRQGKAAGNRASGQSGKSPESAGIPHIQPYSGGKCRQACRRSPSCHAACSCPAACFAIRGKTNRACPCACRRYCPQNRGASSTTTTDQKESCHAGRYGNRL